MDYSILAFLYARFKQKQVLHPQHLPD